MLKVACSITVHTITVDTLTVYTITVDTLTVYNPSSGIGGTRFISFEDRHWHNDCFICAMCKGSLVGKGFITDGSDILCPECAKQKLT